ncbi:class D beta-lactamase [Leptospira yasudae]|uniref:class D beta-lactamase n=1 Tax=Leptospira yasudae TaxID=2202201 RepID=UPI000E59DD2F|nr:class D beta-lactamase [Leptospira yasudae]RHX93987.1 class D beta-lactamase [Leptospira yasudae]
MNQICSFLKPICGPIRFFFPSFVFLLLLIPFGFCKTLPPVDRGFASHGISGTLIVSSLDGSREWIHDMERSERRFLPASTFKILNTLIALRENVADERATVFRWNGTKYPFEDWNRDHSLLSAFQKSCVWCYQELAQKIGLKKYDRYLQNIEYGNGKTGTNVRTFWLERDLRISAREQIRFLKRLYRKELGFQPQDYETLRRIFLVSDESEFSLYAKTGWATTEPQVGWYVGYLENGNDVWFFALNLDVRGQEDLRLRKEILLQTLQDLRLIPNRSIRFR